MQAEQQTFIDKYRGHLKGVLQWSDLDNFWTTIRNDAGNGWYIYAISETPPTVTSDKTQVEKFINNVDELLRREHEEEYCGIVYADDIRSPTFIKIFDPNNLGVSCGYSDNPPPPGWVLSKQKPVDIKTDIPLPGNRRRWWNKLFGT
jgi:hypothetical protein